MPRSRRPLPPRSEGKPVRTLLWLSSLLLAGVALLLAFGRGSAPGQTGGENAVRLQPSDPFLVGRAEAPAWQRVEPGLGRIAWVESRTDPSVQPPILAGWNRAPGVWDLRWPQGKPLENPASFGPSGDLAAAWFLVQSSAPSLELWHVDKNSVRLTGAAGKPLTWQGGTGASLVDGDLRLQYVYLLVPRDQVGSGARLTFTLARFDSARTQSRAVTVAF